MSPKSVDTTESTPVVCISEDKLKKLFTGIFVSESGKKEQDGIVVIKYLFESQPSTSLWSKAAQIFSDKIAQPRFSAIFDDKNTLDSNLTGRLTAYPVKNESGKMGDTWSRKLVTMGDLKEYVSNMTLVNEILEKSRGILVDVHEKTITSDKPLDIVKQYGNEYREGFIPLAWLEEEVKEGRLTSEQLEKITVK